MTSRLRVFSLVCVSLCLVSVQLLAQSSATSFVGHTAKAFKQHVKRHASAGLCLTRYLTGSGGDGANAVALADVNGDGKPDLAVANWCAYSELHHCRH